ncbi:MAG: amino acid ABC transporter permease [Clostridia bacterium]|nr:amino acid ABC transporter permease [Clostridia bacterium]
MFSDVLTALAAGFGKTLQIFFLTLAGAVPLGLVIAFGSMSRFKPLKYAVRGLIWIIRGTPLMLQLIVIFYGPALIFGFDPWGGANSGRLAATLFSFILNYACYFSEIYRGGIESISKGQYEAGQVLGMTRSQVFFRVVLLQVVKRIMAPMSNEIITLVKDTSLARVVAVSELLFKAEAFTKSQGLIWPLFFTGVFYLLFSGLLTVVFGKLEKKLSYFN